MKNGQENWTEKVKDAASGYGVVVLGVVCFLLSLTVLIAFVRFLVGLRLGA